MATSSIPGENSRVPTATIHFMNDDSLDRGQPLPLTRKQNIYVLPLM